MILPISSTKSGRTGRPPLVPTALALVLGLALSAEARAQEVESNADGVVGRQAFETAAEALVRPGDKISLEVWREEDWSGEFPVDERGDVVLPRLGSVRVADIAAGDLRDSLRLRYAEYLRSPEVEVAVLRRIAVHGEVKEPTLYWVDLTMTLRDAIALAGGVTPEGNPGRIFIERGDQRIRLSDADGDDLTLIAAGLRSGDQIIVERRSWFALNTPFVISTMVSVTSILAGFLLAR